MDLAAVLQREHREIDCWIASFVESTRAAEVTPAPLDLALSALRRHIYLEEVFVFPPMCEGGMVMPIFVMMREHGELWRSIDRINEQIEAGADNRRLRATCHQLLTQLEQHNTKEEAVIYPLTGTVLPPQTTGELARFIAAGRLPDGWVCQHAKEK